MTIKLEDYILNIKKTLQFWYKPALVYRSTTIDEVEEDISINPNCIVGFRAYNPNVSDVFLKFCNSTAANTTVGTTPVACGPFLIPALSQVILTNDGIQHDFTIASCVYAVTGSGDNNSTAPTSDVIVEIYYKKLL